MQFPAHGASNGDGSAMHGQRSHEVRRSMDARDVAHLNERIRQDESNAMPRSVAPKSSHEAFFEERRRMCARQGRGCM
ncbi:hypothetical protein C5O80_34150 [Burkholderia sp. SRS-46]|nr:hypothetical protein C5O80_34150 [Burkholderia sp. SRS-46]